MTEILRHRDRLTIRWQNDAGDRWVVTKRFGWRSREVLPATVSTNAPTSWDSADEALELASELRDAAKLAETMDALLERPEDFDRVKVADEPPTGGRPAQMWLGDDDVIYIAVQK